MRIWESFPGTAGHDVCVLSQLGKTGHVAGLFRAWGEWVKVDLVWVEEWMHL